jgi:hypothetical protein
VGRRGPAPHPARLDELPPTKPPASPPKGRGGYQPLSSEDRLRSLGGDRRRGGFMWACTPLSVSRIVWAWRRASASVPSRRASVLTAQQRSPEGLRFKRHPGGPLRRLRRWRPCEGWGAACLDLAWFHPPWCHSCRSKWRSFPTTQACPGGAGSLQLEAARVRLQQQGLAKRRLVRRLRSR